VREGWLRRFVRRVWLGWRVGEGRLEKLGKGGLVREF
jgi:hypothetical protein